MCERLIPFGAEIVASTSRIDLRTGSRGGRMSLDSVQEFHNSYLETDFNDVNSWSDSDVVAARGASSSSCRTSLLTVNSGTQDVCEITRNNDDQGWTILGDTTLPLLE